jgi:hypothetical protein
MTNAGSTEAAGQMPTLAELFPVAEQARALERFLGRWSVEGTLTVEGNPLRMRGEWLFSPAAAGWGVKGTLRAEIDGMGVYEEDDLVGFDVETGSLHLYSLTNSAAVHDHVASWSSADVFEFDYEGLQGGKPYREVGRAEFLGADRLQIDSTDHVEGQLSSEMKATLRRR